MNWLEISLELQADLAEPAAELLSRFTPNGVAVETSDDRVRVRAWLPDDEDLPDRRRRFEEGLWHLSQIQPFPEPVYKLIEDEPWEMVWKEQYQPLEIGERLQILPSWTDQESGSRIPLYLEPGMAFGTGAHTTTRHCLEAIELLVEEGDVVADIGCGSGILAIAAALLGASKVLALDTDPEAVRLSTENVVRNGVTDRVRVESGSLLDLEGSDGLQLIVANIRASVLETFFQDGVSRFLSPGGRIVMSGILEDQLDSLLEGGKADVLDVERVMETDDWRSVILKK